MSQNGRLWRDPSLLLGEVSEVASQNYSSEKHVERSITHRTNFRGRERKLRLGEASLVTERTTGRVQHNSWENSPMSQNSRIRRDPHCSSEMFPGSKKGHVKRATATTRKNFRGHRKRLWRDPSLLLGEFSEVAARTTPRRSIPGRRKDDCGGIRTTPRRCFPGHTKDM